MAGPPGPIAAAEAAFSQSLSKLQCVVLAIESVLQAPVLGSFKACITLVLKTVFLSYHALFLPEALQSQKSYVLKSQFLCQ